MMPMLILTYEFSEHERLNAFFNPGKTILSDEFLEKHKPDILKYMLIQGVSYPTEIAKNVSLHIETVNKILNRLANDEIVIKIKPDRDHPQPIFYHKVYSYEYESYREFARRSWWILTETGIAYCKLNFKGTKTQISPKLIRHYGLKIDDAHAGDGQRA